MSSVRKMTFAHKCIFISEFNIHSLRGRQLCTFDLGCNRLLHPPKVHLAGVHCPPPGTKIPLCLSPQSAPVSTPENYTDSEEAPQHQLGSADCGKPRAPLSYHCLIARKLSHPFLGIWYVWRRLHCVHGHCCVPRKKVRI